MLCVTRLSKSGSHEHTQIRFLTSTKRLHGCAADYLAVEHSSRSVNLVVRGTTQLRDLLTNICGHCEPFFGGAYAHGVGVGACSTGMHMGWVHGGGAYRRCGLLVWARMPAFETPYPIEGPIPITGGQDATRPA